MRIPRSFAPVILAVLFAGAYGTPAAATPVPQHVSVVKLTHMDILRNGQPSGRMSLAVGTTLDVDGVDGDYVLVHIRLLRGRVPAVDTDFDVMAAAPEGSMPQKMVPPARDTAPPAQSSASLKAAPLRAASPPAASAAKPVAAAPVSWKMDSGTGSGSGTRRPGAMFGLTFFFFFAALGVLMIAAQWRLYVKAGKPGWACLVPIYNMIVYLQIAGKPVWWFLLYFVPVVNIVISIMSVFAFANKFGKGTGFALGMVFLPFVFVPILAFSDAPYLG